jgi:hypothetical protein
MPRLSSLTSRLLAGRAITISAASGLVTGNITVGYNNLVGDRYGYQSGFPGPYGSANNTPVGIIQGLFRDVSSNYTALRFNGGTLGIYTTDSMSGLINTITSLTVRLGGQTAILTSSGPSAGGYSITGDPFSLLSKNGQTLTLSINI